MAPPKYSIPRPPDPPKRRYWLIGILVCLGLGFGATLGIAWYGATGLPSLDTLHEYQPNLITKIHSDSGQNIGQFYVERRILTPIAEIPQDLINAVIAVEDSRFFDHPGLDLFGILRATWTNLRRGGKIEGASTITQQLARSLFLSPERTYRRKIRELLLAIKIEFVLTKHEILELYLNQIYFGHGAYGIGSASLTYFGKGLSELTLPESAFLAGLPKAPSTYSPYVNPEPSKKRQEHVIGRMIQVGYITQEEGATASSTPLHYKRQSIERVGPYFLEHVRQHLMSQYGETMLYKGGLQVFTTLNIEMQQLAEKAVQIGLRQLDKRQGWRGPIRREKLPLSAKFLPQSSEALPNPPKPQDIVEGIVTKVLPEYAQVVVAKRQATLKLKDMLWARRRLQKNALVTEAIKYPNATVKQLLRPGDVIEIRMIPLKDGTFRLKLEQTPIVQGALMALDPRTGAIRAMVGGYDYERSQFNRARLALRQPGSAFKPIIYATGLQEGMTPATLVMDAPVVYEQEDPGKTWKPENYEKRFFGTITLREALRHSRNAATVRLLEQIGVRNVIDFAKTLGIKSSLDQDLSLALGSSSLTLEELTSAYGVFSNQGLALQPYTLSIVKDYDGHTLEQHLFEPREVVSKETSYLITHMMMDVIQTGTGRKAKIIGRPLAGKTGTTNSFRDAWFVGYAPNLAVGVWVGFDGAQTLGKVESGAHAALPIWIAFMSKALESLPVKTFTIPAGIQFAQINSKTGALSKEHSETTTMEVFAKGTVPKAIPIAAPNPLDFYELDQGSFAPQ